MNKQLLSLALVALFGAKGAAQVANVNPTPHTVATTGVTFAAPKQWRVTTDRARATSYAVRALEEVGVAQTPKAAFRITLGVVGDRAVQKFRRHVPEKAEAYYMAVGPKGIVIAGRDERGLYYGVQTLRGMAARGLLETCTIQDRPDVPYRGAIEGFYGQPWSHEHRLRQLDFYGRNKMNVYIYGPKDDPYHRDRWREPYPDSQAREIQALNERAKQRGVNFYWAIHPGVDIQWNDADRDRLVEKLERMYDLGIRSFAVFFDDIWGEGAKGEKQTALLNHLDSVFVKAHGDIAPLLLCPTEYNRSWSSDNSPYLAALGNGLNPGIEVMWTGNSVVHTIDQEAMRWINARIKRKAYIWFNFPVNDFVRDHLLLGPTYGNDPAIADDLSGFVSNPMQYAESSKIALYSIADYTWNMRAYRWDTSWQRAIADLLPSDSLALSTFAAYNEDLGPNGHRFRRDESRHLLALQKRLEQQLDGTRANGKPDKTDIDSLALHCRNLETACDLLLANTDNPWLISEIKPWLVQGKLVAQYGNLVCRIDRETSDADERTALNSFENAYRQARALRKLMYANEIDKQQLHVYQTGTKIATLRLLPTLDKVLNAAIARHNTERDTNFPPLAAYTPYTLTATVPQLAHQPITLTDYGKAAAINPSNEVVKWAPDAQITVSFERAATLQGLDFNFGVPAIAPKFRLQVKTDDGTWRDISLTHYKADDPVVHTGSELSGIVATAFRLTNIAGEELKCPFRHFRWSVK